jgi:hypothetical protein
MWATTFRRNNVTLVHAQVLRITVALATIALCGLAQPEAITVAVSSGTTWHVGPDRTGTNTFTSPLAAFSSGQLKNGDTVLIDACTYTNDYDGASNNNLSAAVTIDAVASSSPHCVITDPWSGKHPDHPPMAVITVATCKDANQLCYWGIAKGEWNIDVGGITINHIAFLNAFNQPGGTNGAGLRVEMPSGTLTVNNSVFAHNQNGILGTTGGVVILNNDEFWDNGLGGCYDQCTHQVYLSESEVTINSCYFHDMATTVTPYDSPPLIAGIGNQIKSRSRNTTIINTRIYEGNSVSSYKVDIPNGGNLVLRNSVIQQGPNTQQSRIIEIGAEGVKNPTSTLQIVGNTIINDFAGPTVTLTQDVTTVTAQFVNNSLWGLTNATSNGGTGPMTSSGNITLTARPVLDTSSPVH